MENFILKVPEWQGELVFSEEVIVFVLTVFLMAVGILLCIRGYKYFQTFCFMGLCGMMCYFAYKTAERMTGNRVIQMTLTVTLTFVGLCITYFASILMNYMLEKIRIRQGLVKQRFLFASVAGGAVIGFTIYYGIYHNRRTAVLTGTAAGLLGILAQYKNRKKQIRFRTYNDLMKMKLPEKYLIDKGEQV